MKQVYILDGSWYIFRAFYGLQPLTNEDGQQVHAIYGFFRQLFRLLERKPHYFCIAWDSPVQTIRKDTFEAYKANRIKLPDEFKRQIKAIKRITEELEIPALEMPWYEADDIIATLVKPCDPELLYTVVSSDKDLKQLICQNVVQYDAMKEKTTDVQAFEEEFWFPPEQMLDYLALIGDSSDNVPWIPGIWPKSATDLIKKYGTLENIYEHLDECSPAVKEKLINGKESGFKSKHLIGLRQVPWMEGYDLEKFRFKLNTELCEKILIDERKFVSLQKHITPYKKEQYGGQQESLFW